jgi:hypothetical protein
MGWIKPRTVSELMDIANRFAAKMHVTIKGHGHLKMTGETDTTVKGEDPATTTTTVLIVK